MSNLSVKPMVVVTGSFDNVRSHQIRFLQEASRLGRLHVILWSDQTLLKRNGKAPKFLEAERRYFLENIRYVSQVSIVEDTAGADSLPQAVDVQPGLIWAVEEEADTPAKKAYCAAQGIFYRVFSSADLAGFPLDGLDAPVGKAVQKRAVVTGCYDWLHSGHVRFFEEASEFGELFVVVGHDENLRLLKGEGHPLFPEDERRYMVQSIRFVKQAQISSGQGWMDAEPEIDVIQPDYYVVNEDGDKPEKREFCSGHGIEYKVLKRLPKPGLPRRESTSLRGF
jgi:cytidyltransferase-like protein